MHQSFICVLQFCFISFMYLYFIFCKSFFFVTVLRDVLRPKRRDAQTGIFVYLSFHACKL